MAITLQKNLSETKSGIGTIIELDERITTIAKELKRLEDQRKELVNSLVETGNTRDGMFILVNKPTSRSTVDVEKLKKARLDIYEKFAEVSIPVASIRRYLKEDADQFLITKYYEKWEVEIHSNLGL